MATPLLHQALDFNTLIWRIGPYIRFPFQWNQQKQKFEAEKNPKRQLIWLLTSTLSFGILFAQLIFLLCVGLKAAHNDKLKNWILIFELLPLVAYIFLYNWKMYSTGLANYVEYHNSLTKILKQYSKTPPTIEPLSTGKKLLQFAGNLLQGML